MGRVALITGGSRGIGAATAALMAQRGWDICLTYVDNVAASELAVAACERHGGRAIALRSDVSVEADVVDAFAECAERLGALDALVNNAGIVAARSRVDELDAARVGRMMAVNVVGPIVCAREAVRRMSTRHGGSGGVIVNVSSAAARLGSPGEYVDYAASKGAIDTMTLGLAREVADEGIRVNAVRPGLIETDIHASGGQPDRVARMTPLIPMKRAGRAEEIATTIAWLCSDEASYVTGALLDVSGAR